MGFARKEYEFLSEIGLSPRNVGCNVAGTWKAHGPLVTSFNPSNNQPIPEVVEGYIEDYEKGMQVPAPKRGEIVRQIGDALRARLQQLGRLVSLEMGKILPQGIGEVQEIIDMCDFAVGLSRRLNGSIIPSEPSRMKMLPPIKKSKKRQTQLGRKAAKNLKARDVLAPPEPLSCDGHKLESCISGILIFALC